MRRIAFRTGIFAIALSSGTVTTASDANSSGPRVDQTLIAPLLAGQSGALDRDTAVVGAPETSHSTETTAGIGAAYVYTRTGDTWNETAKLVAMEPGTKWAIGEAASGGLNAEDTYVLVGNLLSEGGRYA